MVTLQNALQMCILNAYTLHKLSIFAYLMYVYLFVYTFAYYIGQRLWIGGVCGNINFAEISAPSVAEFLMSSFNLKRNNNKR